MKNVKGINVFECEADAKKARDKALIANSNWGKTFVLALAGSIVSSVLIYMMKITPAGIVVSFVSWLIAEIIGGKFYWRKVFSELFSGVSGVAVMVFFFECVILTALYAFFFVFCMGGGLGAGLLLMDKWYMRKVVKCTADLGFSDEEVLEKIEKKKKERKERAESLKSGMKEAVQKTSHSENESAVSET